MMNKPNALSMEEARGLRPLKDVVVALVTDDKIGLTEGKGYAVYGMVDLHPLSVVVFYMNDRHQGYFTTHSSFAKRQPETSKT